MRLLSTIAALTLIASTASFAADPTCDAREPKRRSWPAPRSSRS